MTADTWRDRAPRMLQDTLTGPHGEPCFTSTDRRWLWRLERFIAVHGTNPTQHAMRLDLHEYLQETCEHHWDDENGYRYPRAGRLARPQGSAVPLVRPRRRGEVMVGRTYLEKGSPVVVLVAWRQQRKTERVTSLPLVTTKPTSPRNVLIRRADGTVVVRGFRGLRKPTGDAA